MSALTAKGNNLAVDPALLALPINNGSLSQFASVKEDVKRHEDFERPHSDAHSSVADRIVRHIFKKHRQTVWHIPTPPSHSYTERFENGPRRLNKGNTVNGLTSFLFDQPLCSVADNDNWHPLEAA
jgi:hypothetical protein